MQRISEPTGAKNAVSRLFLRFFLFYLVSFLVGLSLALREVIAFLPESVGLFQFIFIALALLGALLTVTRPYLLLLTVFKAFYDAALLYRITLWTRMGAIGMLQWNGGFCLIALSIVLLALSAAKAEWFAFCCKRRDLKLLFSREFGAYLVKASICLAVALSLYFLWPQLFETFGPTV